MRAGRGFRLVALVLGLGCGAPQPPPHGPSSDIPDARTADTRPRDMAAPADAAVPAPDAPGNNNPPDAAPPASDAIVETDAAGDDAGVDATAGDSGPAAGAPARNLRIGLVEVAQSVFIRLGEGAMLVQPGARNAELIEGRPMMVRVHVAPAAGFAPRPLRGQLTVVRPDGGGPLALAEDKTISGPSDSEKMETTFNFLVPAEAMKPGARLWAAVFETGPAAGPEPAPLPRFPPTGDVDLAVRGGRMVMDVVMVPSVGPSGPLDDSPARRLRVENHLYDVYPVQKVNVRWRAPVRFASKVSATMGFQSLVQTRMQDGAAVGTYYHLLLAKEDSSEGLLGIANLAGGTAADANRRIAMTFVEKHAVDTLLDTISHEMGHNHGRNHAPGCNARGVDEAFPYPGPGIGVNGWSLMDMKLAPARTTKELMGYCNVTWVSDYTWRGFANRVRVVSALPGAGSVMPLATRALMGFQAPGQPVAWVMASGPLGPAGRGQGQATIRLDGARAVTAPVGVRLLSDERTRELAVDLPDEGDIAAVEVTVDGSRLSVPASVLAR